MIVDNIKNIEIYKGIIPQYAIEFIKALDSNTALGRHELSKTDYANVEMYKTKLPCDGKFEAHKNYIDIQILLSGTENIYYCSKADLTETAPYDAARDIVFYNNEISYRNFVTLDGTNFAMIFPHEAHAPQISINNNCTEVKKVVLKLKY